MCLTSSIIKVEEKSKMCAGRLLAVIVLDEGLELAVGRKLDDPREAHHECCDEYPIKDGSDPGGGRRRSLKHRAGGEVHKGLQGGSLVLHGRRSNHDHPDDDRRTHVNRREKALKLFLDG